MKTRTKWLRWAVYLGLAFLSIPASAQQSARITGIVLDESGDPVAGSIVSVNPSGTTDTIRTYSDKNGNFSLQLLGKL